MDVQQDYLGHVLAVQNEYTPMILAHPAVNGLDAGFISEKGDLGIRAFIGDGSVMRPEFETTFMKALRDLPEQISGVPLRKIPSVNSLENAWQARQDPVCGGISIGLCAQFNNTHYVGTMGCVVADRKTHTMYGLTNYHVVCPDHSNTRQFDVCQQGIPDGGNCALDTLGLVHGFDLSHRIDAGLITLDQRLGIPEVLGCGRIQGSAGHSLGQPVRKMGRTTGLTRGIISGINATRTIDYGGAKGKVSLSGQFTISPVGPFARWSNRGDSGSAVLDEANYVVGLHFAGDGVNGTANPITFVEQDLGVYILR